MDVTGTPRSRWPYAAAGLLAAAAGAAAGHLAAYFVAPEASPVLAVGSTVIDATPTSLTLRLVSPDGDQGFPGELTVTATYALEGDSVVLTYEATTDAPTILRALAEVENIISATHLLALQSIPDPVTAKTVAQVLARARRGRPRGSGHRKQTAAGSARNRR